MRISKKWIDWAHGGAAEEGQELAGRLVALAQSTKDTAVTLTEPLLVAEVVDVAGLYSHPSQGDELFEKGPWWRGQPKKIIREGNALLRTHNTTASTLLKAHEKS
jgi:hypothetical protein